jgi:serpin B
VEFNDDIQMVELNYYYYDGFGEDKVVQSIKDGSWHILKPDGSLINLKSNYLAFAGIEGKNLNFDNDYYRFVIGNESYDIDYSTRFIYVDKNGMECFVERYKYVDPTKGENYFILRNIKGDGYETGLYHKYNKTVVIPAVYDTLNYISDDRIAAGKNYKYRLINIKQEEIIPFEYDNLDYINDNFVKGGDFAMKEKKIFDAITDVRDERIEEAKDTKLKKKNTRLRKWMAVAACAALLIIGTLYFWEETKSPSSGPIMDVVYPKAYAFENDDTWRKVREGNPVDDNFIAAINNFSYRTGALVLTDEGKNINYSPLSLYYALSIAASGSKSETEAQLLALLGIDDTQELSDQCGNLYRLLYRDNEIGKLKIANSIWMDDHINGEEIIFKDDFVIGSAENFYASSHSVDFAGEETGKAMADWISANTNGTLSPTFETNPEQILTILNTVYFYDQWIDRFDRNKTAEDVFYLSNGSQVKSDFMNQTFVSARFTKGKGFTCAGLSLKNAAQMIFILPDEGVSPYELITSAEQMKEIFEGGEGFNGEVVWKIPKFSFSSKLSMTDVIKELGVSSAFTPEADFTGITDHMAYITGVLQETHIAIDEDGVEASAFTQIDYAGSAMPEGSADMILNRPFIYGITARNDSLLFVGVCENPSE